MEVVETEIITQRRDDEGFTYLRAVAVVEGQVRDDLVLETLFFPVKNPGEEVLTEVRDLHDEFINKIGAIVNREVDKAGVEKAFLQ